MSVQRDRINQARINAGLTPLPETHPATEVEQPKTPCYCDLAYHPEGH